MGRLEKYRGVIPAFYACYDDQGAVSEARTRRLARHLVDKGVKGLYVGGSSGECIPIRISLSTTFPSWRAWPFRFR